MVNLKRIIKSDIISDYAALETYCSRHWNTIFFICDTPFEGSRLDKMLPGVIKDYIKKGMIFGAYIQPTKREILRARKAILLKEIKVNSSVVIFNPKSVNKTPINGQVIAIVPAENTISKSDVVLNDYTLIFKGIAKKRKEQSYLVKVSVDGEEKPRLYCPNLKHLYQPGEELPNV